MFGTPGKVPGSASLLRASETGRLNPARTQSRSTTPGTFLRSDLYFSRSFSAHVLLNFLRNYDTNCGNTVT